MASTELCRRTDSIPQSPEAQREAHEVTLGWNEAVTLKDSENLSYIRLRVHNLVAVFLAASHGPYLGKQAWFDGVDYPLDIAGKEVVVTPTGRDGLDRIFTISKVDGIEVVPDKTDD